MRTLIALLLVCAAPASAATITVAPASGNAPAIVEVQGELRFEDIEAFRFKVAKLSMAVVGFESNAGAFWPASGLGRSSV